MNTNIQKEFEKDIIKKYRGVLWSKFVKGIKEYNLLEPGDKVAVALSGGKDSLLLAKLLQEIQRHGNFHFDLEFIAMDPGFEPENRQLIVDNCKLLGIDVKIFNSDIFEISSKLSKDKPCYLCARMRRGFLYSKAKELGCNKMALGHHFDDVIETTMINILYAGQFKTMVPKADAENFEGMTLIRPMYLIQEKDIIKIMQTHNIISMNCGCPVLSRKAPSKRKEIKDLIKYLDTLHPIMSKNIFKAAENVNLKAVLGYQDDGEIINFNDIYKKVGKK